MSFLPFNHEWNMIVYVLKKRNAAEKQSLHNQLKNRKGYINKKHNLTRTYRK